jgi:L-rhamnose-H+ transport protein
MMTNVFLGIGLHAIGGIAAATCYVPQKGAQNWSYQSYWLLFCFSGWLIMPIAIAMLTVPELAMVLTEAPVDAMANATILGAVYGFGGMAFAVAIGHIGFSLTYSIAIGISAILGTVIPAILAGTLIEGFSKPGGLIVLSGFAISIFGVALCGYAGVLKERELRNSVHSDKNNFDIRKGLVLVIISGVLASVFGLSLSAGNAIDEVAVAHGAGNFQSNAKYIFAMGGAFLTNLVWWGIVHVKQGTLKEYIRLQKNDAAKGSISTHYFFGFLSGVLWYGQFFFYGLGHVRMGNFEFISWGIHMSMLIFFSFGIGFVFKEWSGFCKKTMAILYIGLLVLLTSFGIITYGSWIGGQA